jgi:hypothetical protein|tara:strand:- start:1156 stop:1404 length:249 start_codon:yes stop_codon:yes gene_type:complete
MPSKTRNSALSLQEYTDSKRNAGTGRWCDRLDEETVDAIMQSNAGAKVVSDWLKEHTEYKDASPKKVEPIIDKRRRKQLDLT